MSYRLLVASLVLLAGCQQAPPLQAPSGNARLVVKAGWGRTLQALPSFSRADVNHVTVTLADAADAVITTQELTGNQLDQSLEFDHLAANASYHLSAKAYRAAGTLKTDVIGTSATATVTAGTDDAPTVATLPVTLRSGMGAGVSGVTTTLAGKAGSGFQDGAASVARFGTIAGVALDAAGNLYVADQNNNRVRKVAPDGTTSTVAGDGTAATLNGDVSIAELSHPLHVAVAPDGTVYVDSQGAGLQPIRKIATDGTVSTFATMTGANSLMCDAQGNLYVGNATGVTMLTPAGVPTVLETSVTFVTGLAVDADGLLYLADNSGNVYTLSQGGTLSAPRATNAQLFGLAVDSLRNVYVTDASAHKVKRLAPDGTVTVVAGSGATGSLDDLLLDGGATASFWAPYGIAVDADGTLYVADQVTAKIRRIL